MGRAEISLEGVTRRFSPGAPPAVDALSLQILRGEIFALFGPSGCGKTTTLRLIAGFERSDEGRIWIADRLVDEPGFCLSPEERRIGFVFQDYALFPHLSVAANVAFGLNRLRPPARAARAREVLALCALEGLEDRYPHELSGGQQQRVAVARALAPDYPVVLLDEPLSNLDAALRGSLRADLHRILKASGKTALLVTHDREEAFEMADRIGVLLRGRLRQVGTPEALHCRPETAEVARLVSNACLLPGRIGDGAIWTEAGSLPLNPVLAGAGAVTVLVPEEAVRIRLDRSGTAKVEKWFFRGPDHVIQLRLPSGAEIRSRGSYPERLEVGTRVAVELAPDRIAVLPEEVAEG